MISGNKYRIYPNKQQQTFLDSHFNAVRIIYNLALETKNTAYYDYGVKLNKNDLSGQLTDLKKEITWLKGINSQSLQGALTRLDVAFAEYFRDLKDGTVAKRKEAYINKRNKKGLPINWNKYNNICKPKFKSKKDNNFSFQVPQSFELIENKLYIPKLKTGIKTIVSSDCHGEHLNLTISKTATGQYYCSICVDDKAKAPKLKKIKENTAVGIDLGIKTFAVCSDGVEFENPKHLKNSLTRLKVIQKRLSRKQKNGKNRNKNRLSVAKLHEKISNQRKDFLHKTSSAITKQYDTVIVEDLAVKNMIQNHKLAQVISDVSWDTFTTFLKYKCTKFGKNYIEINRYFPSSKMHFDCGYINNNLTLKDRDWHCHICKKSVPRDLNAAINIKYSGLGRPTEPLELPTLVGALKKEASTPLG